MTVIKLEDMMRRPLPQDPITRPGGGEDGGPTRPSIRRPDSNELIKRMKRIDPDQAKRYRQRSGQ